MNLLSRIFRRTPSLRTRVALATAIGAAIAVAHRRHRRVDRHHQRPQGAAGPPARRSGRVRDPVLAARVSTRSPNRPTIKTPSSPCARTARSRPTPTSCCPSSIPVTPTPTSTACATACGRWRSGQPEPMSVAVGATYDATIADTNNLHRRVLIIGVFSDRRRDRAGLAAGRIRGAPAQTPGRADPADRRRRRGTRRRSPRRHRGRRDRRRRQWHAAAHLERAGPHQGGAGVGPRLLRGVGARTAHAVDRDADQSRGALYARSARGAA